MYNSRIYTDAALWPICTNFGLRACSSHEHNQ